MNLLALCVLLAQDPIRVVTTLPVLASLAREAGGERVRAEALAAPGRDPHFIEPDPNLMKKAAGADLFVELGMGLDLWGATVVESSGNVKIQRGTAGWITASAGCWKGELPREISRAWGDVHPDGNPHVWLDPANAVAMARTIAEALAKADAAHAAEYAGRADDFESRVVKAWIGEACAAEIKPDHLRRLASRGKLLEFIEGSETLKGKLGGWARKAAPLKGIKVVSYHKTYFYLARQFGFEIVAELEEFPGKDPPPKHKAEVVKIVKEKGAKLILNDVFYPRDAADFVAAETGAKVVVTHIEIGSQEGTSDYFGLIDRMLDALTGALR